MTKQRPFIRQLMAFGVVGIVAFGIDYGILMLLTQALGTDPVVAAALSFSVSVAFNYVASMRFVFASRHDLSRTREFSTFVVLSLAGLALNEVGMWAGTRALGTDTLALTVTKVATTVVVMVWNFWSKRRWLDASSGHDVV